MTSARRAIPEYFTEESSHRPGPGERWVRGGTATGGLPVSQHVTELISNNNNALRNSAVTSQ